MASIIDRYFPAIGRAVLGLARWAACAACMIAVGVAHAQRLSAASVSPKRVDLQEPVTLAVKLDRFTAGCGVLLRDGAGQEQRFVVRDGGGQRVLTYAHDGQYVVTLEGKPMLEGYDLYSACDGRAQATVIVESKANRTKRLAAEAAAQQAAQAKAEAQAKIDAQRQVLEAQKAREEQAQEVVRQKAALEAAARQRVIDEAARKKAAFEAELAAAREALQRAQNMSAWEKFMSAFKPKHAQIPPAGNDGAGDTSTQTQ